MNLLEAWQAIKRLTKEEVIAKTKALGLSKERKDLLFNLVEGHTKANFWCQKEIEEFLLKWLEPKVHKLLPLEDHLYLGTSQNPDPAHSAPL